MKQVIRTNLPLVMPIARICAYKNCGKTLTSLQKKFCSHTCRNFVNSPGNAGGPKGKYRSEFSGVKFEQYIARCEKNHEPTLIPTKTSYIVLPNADLPSNQGYAQFIGVNVSTLDNWAKKHYEFSLTMERLKSIQKTFLIDNGLSGRYNARLVILMLAANHGMILKKRHTYDEKKIIGVLRHIFAHRKVQGTY